MDSTLGPVIFLMILTALIAALSCAESAVISMNDTRLAKLAQSGDKRAQRLVKLTSQPTRFLTTIQIAITMAGFLGSAFAVAEGGMRV